MTSSRVSASLLRNTSWSAAATVISTGGRLVVVALVARRLGPASFGAFIFVQWLVEMASVICLAGLPNVATRFFPQTAVDGEAQIRGFGPWFLRWGAKASLLTAVAAAAAALVFSEIKTGMAVALIGFWAMNYSAWSLLAARAQGLFQFNRYAIASVLSVGVTIVGVAVPGLCRDVPSTIVIFGTANLAAAVWCGIGVLAARGSSGVEDLTMSDNARIWAYARNGWVTSLGGSFIWSRGEISVVKAHLGESAVGFYSIGITIASIVNQGVGLLTGGLWPQIAGRWDAGDREGVIRLSTFVSNMLMLAAGLAAGVVFCFAPYLIGILFGPAFLESTNLALILAIGSLGLSSGCANLVLQAATDGRFPRNVTFVGGVSLFALAFILVPYFGIAGAAAARSAAQVGIAITTFIWVGRIVGEDARLRRSLRSFLVLVATAVVLVVVLGLQPNLDLAGRLVLFVLYSGAVVALCAPLKEARSLRQLRALVSGAHA